MFGTGGASAEGFLFLGRPTGHFAVISTCPHSLGKNDKARCSSLLMFEKQSNLSNSTCTCTIDYKVTLDMFSVYYVHSRTTCTVEYVLAHVQLALQISIPVPSCTSTVVPRSRCVLDLPQHVHVRRGCSSSTKRSHRELRGP